jgi:hypothetical protein
VGAEQGNAASGEDVSSTPGGEAPGDATSPESPAPTPPEASEPVAQGPGETSEAEVGQGPVDGVPSDQPGPAPTSPDGPTPDYLKAAQEAFAGRLSDTPALKQLWERAANGRTSFPSARAEFWRLVNNDTGPDAQAVRDILHTAGFDTHPGTSNAPTLDVDGYEAVRPEDANRVRADLMLSIDHVNAQAHGGAKLDASNLRFLSTRDNSTRGARYDENDRLIGVERDADGNRITPFPEMTSEERRERELFRERVLDLLEKRKQNPGQ